MIISSQAMGPATLSVWTGRLLSALVALFLTFDGTIKIALLHEHPQAASQLGWSAEMGVPLGIVLLICTLLYAIPRTAILGAILLTGYLGGAIATHARIESPLFTHILFGAYIGVAAWGGIFLRSPKLRELIPWQY